MPTTIAALIATLFTTGMTSTVSHQLTIIGGSIATVIFAASVAIRPNANVYPAFLFGTVAMIVIALVSSEATTAPFSSTIHVLCMYTALLGLAFSSPHLSNFCQQFMIGTNLLLTASILYQGQHVETVKAWQISSPSGATNSMATQINMTLPLILARITASTGQKKFAYVALVCLNCMAVVLVMSRNGIGTMLIILTLYVLFNHKRLAVLVSSTIMGLVVSLDSILQLPLVNEVLTKMRFVGYTSATPRTLIWQLAWNDIKLHPILGVGPGGPQKTLGMLDIYHAHNNYMQVALETGIPSGLIFTLLVLLLLRLFGKAILQSPAAFVYTLPILAYFTNSCTELPLSQPGTTLLLMACVHEARVEMQRQNRTIPALENYTRLPVKQSMARAA